METFISVEKAQALIRQSLPQPETEIVPLSQALGRTLAREVASKEAIPPFPNSAMDGFAVQSSDLTDLGGRLRLLGEVRAGQWPAPVVTTGGCVQIMTGAPIPEGADAVVPVEWTRSEAGFVVVDRAVPVGRHIRPSGQDMAQGEVVLAPGYRVDAGGISTLATVGETEVLVGRQPRVAVVSTGDELVAPGSIPGPGQIRNSNGPAMAARVLAAGALVAAELHAKDDLASVRAVIQEARTADVLVFSGGVSVGEYDLVRQVLEEEGLESLFWKVKQRPGKPLAFGLLDSKPVFGLPGNPVSTGVCFDQYVRPALRLMQGSSRPDRNRLLAVLEEDFGKPPGLHVFARGKISQGPEGQLRVHQAGGQGSNLSMSMVRADCLVHLPAKWDSAKAGSEVLVELTRKML